MSIIDSKLNVLLLGSGGREHALLQKISESKRAGNLYVCPGNGGMWQLAQKVELNPNSPQEVAEFARAHAIDLVVIGPEAPLVTGVADAVSAAGIAVFGPTASAARMEGSKQFAKEIMQRAGVPTAAYKAFTDEQACAAYVQEVNGPVVVKADGLAAGKGVIVAQTTQEALAGVHECFSAFGDAGKVVVVEEMLKGPECSLLALTDGKTLIPLATSQDHKRALEGDCGPNTGGMGVYSPVPFVTDQELAAMVEIEQKVVDQLASEGITYKGCLYGGFMLTKDGPKVLEFNAGFGDPETQVVIPRMHADLLDVFMHIDAGTLDQTTIDWSESWAVSVVLTSAGYPGAYKTGKVITGIEEAQALEGVTVYQAGTARNEKGQLVTAGGRVINVTALAQSFEAAREQAYAACDLIAFEGKALRRDIGLRALRGRDTWEV
ncbi:phosphoribosylamine--glycine ligase [Atopobium minutum]|uniref:phosphoribosylamine--glycine ligase n=1 Tax=Atopobium minutum TaxID=1381 RepID=UPI00280B4502|nr:phosphoribosylamine--glycine ligase [Atopobium minutum]